MARKGHAILPSAAASLALVAAAALASGAHAGAAQAGAAESDAATTAASAAAEASVQEFERRIEHAAQRVCGRPSFREAGSMREVRARRACIAKSISKARERAEQERTVADRPREAS